MFLEKTSAQSTEVPIEVCADVDQQFRAMDRSPEPKTTPNSNPYREGEMIKAYYTKPKSDFLHHPCRQTNGKSLEGQARLKSLKLSPVRMREWTREVAADSTRDPAYCRAKDDYPNYFEASSCESPDVALQKSSRMKPKNVTS